MTQTSARIRPAASARLVLVTLTTLVALTVRAQVAPDPATAQPVSLLTVWQAVQANDPGLRAQRAERDASGTARQQAGALWRPSVVLQGTAGVARQSVQMNGAHFDAPGMGSLSGVNFATSVHAGPTARVGIVLQQALFNPARRAQGQQLERQAELGEANWQAQLDQARLQTAEHCVGLVLADARVQWLAELERTLQQVAQEAQDRFRLGAAPVTDVHEAQAELAKARAQRLAQQLQADAERQRLAAASGLRLGGGEQPLSLNEFTPLPPNSLEIELPKLEQNPVLRRSQIAVAMAQAEVARTRPGADAQISLVAQSSHDRLSGQGDFGSASNRNTQHLIGVQATLPIYTGGMQSAQQQAAVHRLAQADAQRDAVRAQLEQQLLQTWQSRAVADARVAALQAALAASRERLSATRLGREVGERTTLDVLNAENALAQDRWALAEAQGQRLLASLRLAALTGELDDAALQRSAPGLLRAR